MIIKSYSEFRNNMKAVLDSLVANNDVAVITRKNDNFYVLTEEEYNGIQETLYLWENSANREHLETSLEEIENHQTKSFDDVSKL